MHACMHVCMCACMNICICVSLHAHKYACMVFVGIDVQKYISTFNSIFNIKSLILHN